jgi:hypothetical protein
MRDSAIPHRADSRTAIAEISFFIPAFLLGTIVSNKDITIYNTMKFLKNGPFSAPAAIDMAFFWSYNTIKPED